MLDMEFVRLGELKGYLIVFGIHKARREYI